MSREIKFTKTALNDLEFWKRNNNKTILKIKELLIDIDNNHPLGIGKTEKLKGFEDIYSRRINNKDRLVYSVYETYIIVYQCKGHYNDK